MHTASDWVHVQATSGSPKHLTARLLAAAQALQQYKGEALDIGNIHAVASV
jgi:hypothetical protein